MSSYVKDRSHLRAARSHAARRATLKALRQLESTVRAFLAFAADCATLVALTDGLLSVRCGFAFLCLTEAQGHNFLLASFERG